MKLPYDITANPTWQGFELAKLSINDVATSRRRMAMICSPTGFGKTYWAHRIFRWRQVRYHGSNPTDEHSLVKTLWDCYRQGIDVGILDDVDSVARKETTANLLKVGFGDRGKIVFETVASIRNDEYKTAEDERLRKRYNPSIPPPWFYVLMRLLWLSNLNYTDPAVLDVLPDHFRALVSRGLDPVWIPGDIEHDGFAVFIYTHWAATEGNMLRGKGYPYDVSRLAVAFYLDNVHRLIDICPRRLEQIAKVIRDNSNLAARELRLEAMLRSTDQRPKLHLPEPWVSVMRWPDAAPQRPAKKTDANPLVRPPHAPPDVVTEAASDPSTLNAVRMAGEGIDVQDVSQPVPGRSDPVLPSPLQVEDQRAPSIGSHEYPAIRCGLVGDNEDRLEHPTPAGEPIADSGSSPLRSQPQLRDCSAQSPTAESMSDRSLSEVEQVTDGEQDGLTGLLTTPMSELDIPLPEVDDPAFARLTGDGASIEAALLVRRKVFAAVDALPESRSMSLGDIGIERANFLRRLRSHKFWIAHADSTLTQVMEAAKVRMHTRPKNSET